MLPVKINYMLMLRVRGVSPEAEKSLYDVKIRDSKILFDTNTQTLFLYACKIIIRIHMPKSQIVRWCYALFNSICYTWSIGYLRMGDCLRHPWRLGKSPPADVMILRSRKLRRKSTCGASVGRAASRPALRPKCSLAQSAHRPIIDCQKIFWSHESHIL